MTREEAFHVIDTYCVPSAYPHTEQWGILQKIKEALEVLKQEPREGHWIYTRDYMITGGWFDCSECGKRVEMKSRYCPNCGARMESEVSDETSN